MNATFPKIEIERTQNPKPSPGGPLGFGQHFSDHLFLAEYDAKEGWISAKILPYQNFSLSPACSVFHYAQSVFEGLKAFRTVTGNIQLFRPGYHAHRLQKSAEMLCLPRVETPDFIEACQTLVAVDKRFVPSGNGESLYLRPLLFASENFLGVRPASRALFVIIACPVGGYYGEAFKPTSIWIEEKAARTAPGSIGFAKTGGNYAASLNAAMKAKAAGYDQVLWLDACHHRFVEEVGTMNIFFRFQDKLVTPPLSDHILAGCTRDSVITLAKSLQIPVEERPITVDELFAAHKSGHLKEAFGTGTAAVISPICKMATLSQTLDFAQHETAAQFYKRITEIQTGQAPDQNDWTLRVEC